MRPAHAVVLPDTPGLAPAKGVTHVEIEGLVDRPEHHLDALADSGLFVACVRLGPAGGATVEERRRDLERQKRQVADAARLGATVALLTPPPDGPAPWMWAWPTRRC